VALPRELTCLERRYQDLLATSGLDLAFRDATPTSWPDLYVDGDLNVKAARQAIRFLESSRGYTTFESIGTEPEPDYLYRLARAGVVDGPYLAEGLSALQQVLADETTEVLAWAAESRIVLPHPVYAGVFPTGELNAQAQFEQGCGSLILVNSGLMDLIYVFLKTNFASSGSPSAPALITEAQVVKVLADEVNAYLYSSGTQRAWGYPSLPDRMVGPLTLVLRRAEQFVVAHELGHIALGHVQANQEPVSPSAERELAADDLAVMLLVQGVGGSRTEATYLAGSICTFLILARLMERMRGDLELPIPESESHPDFDLREENLRSRLSQVFGDAGVLEAADRFAAWIEVFRPRILEQIRTVDLVMSRPPYVRR
jgi:hypothetical protein